MMKHNSKQDNLLAGLAKKMNKYKCIGKNSGNHRCGMV